MPRSQKRVKKKSAPRGILTPGLIDLHFHGAFGIDLMRATPAELDELSARLAESGLAGFCPTTLSVAAPELKEVVTKLGKWINESHLRAAKPGSNSAIPLGIHLEGPFISPKAAGAHPPGVIRKLDFAELDGLWERSQKTLKILTVAPESTPPADWKKLARWCRDRKVHLSLGHTPTDEETARAAFDCGFRGLTHAWNALSFHHRLPGALGAALGRKGVFVELIVDGVHVHPTVVRWTQKLHHPEPLCWVSDGAPAAGLPEGSHAPFGPLEIIHRDGACRLARGELAGGGLLLPECAARWLKESHKQTNQNTRELLREILPFVTENPLRALEISGKSRLGQALNRLKIEWDLRKTGEFRVRFSR